MASLTTAGSPALSLSDRLPSLDGWRAVSILMVLGAHCHYCPGFPARLEPLFNWLWDGNLGVRFFFVISGFLITWLMLVEYDRSGSVSLKGFYARRAFRILPVYLAFLGTVALLQCFTPFSQSPLAWVGNLAFATNFINGAWPTGHLWSLSTEEQFYILWPGLLVWLGLATRSGRALRLLALPLLLAPCARLIRYKGVPALLFPLCQNASFFLYFDSLAIGCAAAIILARHRKLLEAYLSRRRGQVLTLALALVLVPHLLLHLRPFRYVMVPFASSLQGWGCALLLLLSVLYAHWGAFKLLNWRWVARLGVLSYSIYLWQQLFCSGPQTFGLRPVWWMSFPGWLVAVLAVSTLSYYGLERPFLRFRARFRKPLGPQHRAVRVTSPAESVAASSAD